jgi:hypothetical protein
MSATGNPMAIVWVIRQDPQDATSLFAMQVDDHKLVVCLFTQSENGEEFARRSPDVPVGAVIAPVEAPGLAQVLTEQAQRRRTHVVTDPILGASEDNDRRTLTIQDYLDKLGG